MLKITLGIALFISIGLNCWLAWKVADQYGAIEACVEQEAFLKK